MFKATGDVPLQADCVSILTPPRIVRRLARVATISKDHSWRIADDRIADILWLESLKLQSDTTYITISCLGRGLP